MRICTWGTHRSNTCQFLHRFNQLYIIILDLRHLKSRVDLSKHFHNLFGFIDSALEICHQSCISETITIRSIINQLKISQSQQTDISALASRSSTTTKHKNENEDNIPYYPVWSEEHKLPGTKWHCSFFHYILLHKIITNTANNRCRSYRLECLKSPGLELRKCLFLYNSSFNNLDVFIPWPTSTTLLYNIAQ